MSLQIYDTTLRDGEQAPSNAMTLQSKLTLFAELDKLKLDYIDIGFPYASELDYQFCQKVLHNKKRKTKVSLLARAKRQDLEKTVSILNEARSDQIQILLLGSEIHVEQKRKISLTKALKETKDSIPFVKSLGVSDIAAGLEDATRASFDYLKKIIAISIDAGATSIVLADTVGFCIPVEIALLVRKVKKFVGPDIKVSIHCHNDLGLATANTLAAIEQGVDCIQTTIGGIGERAGNAALEEVLAALYYKQQHYQCDNKVPLAKLYPLAQKLSQLAQVKFHPHKPILGSNAFTTAAGIHIHGLLQNPKVYEYIEAEDFGRHRDIIVNRLSGRSAIAELLKACDIDPNRRIVDMLYQQVSAVTDEVISYDKNQLLQLYQQFVH